MIRTFLTGIVVSIITFLTPIKGFLVLMGAMVFADTVYAMYVAYKTGQGLDSLTSDKFFNIAPKLFFYLGSIILAYMCDYYLIGVNHLFGVEMFGTKIVSFAFISNEIKSINETYIKRNNKGMYDTLKEFYTVLKRLKKDVNDLLN
jgi:hypothetical protein